jgi:hypothetical protein
LQTHKFSVVEGTSKIINEDNRSNIRRSWKENLVIESESSNKAVFDVFVLFFVGYSCITSVFNVSFKFDDQQVATTKDFWDYFDSFTEYLFMLDLLLSFI